KQGASGDRRSIETEFAISEKKSKGRTNEHCLRYRCGNAQVKKCGGGHTKKCGHERDVDGYSLLALRDEILVEIGAVHVASRMSHHASYALLLRPSTSSKESRLTTKLSDG